MGYITNLNRRLNSGQKPRKNPWRVYIHHKEPEWTFSKCFRTKEEAELWEAQKEQDYRMRDIPEYQKRREHQKLQGERVRGLIHRYISEGYCSKQNDFVALYAIANRPDMGALFLTKIDKPDAHRYIENRLKETYRREGWSKERQITPGTVSRERNLLLQVFKTAIEKWDGYSTVKNVFKGLRIGGQRRSTRTLREGEEEKLVDAFEGCLGLNKFYVPLAMYLGLDTGMRSQEILNLRWNDIDFERRRITIRKSKTDKKQIAKGRRAGRRIVLPFNAMSSLISLAHSLHTAGHLPHDRSPLPQIKSPITDPDTPIFINRDGKPLTPKAFTQVWRDVVRRARIEPYNDEALTFHCLRRAANIEFTRAGLDGDEKSVMKSGHVTDRMDDIYQDDELEVFLDRIQDKLDRHVLKLKTLDEKGKPVLDKSGNPVLVGMTLAEAVQQTNGRKISNLEMLNMGEIPGVSQYWVTRQRRAQVRAFANKAEKRVEERLAKDKIEKVAVLTVNKTRKTLRALGYYTKHDAYKLLGLDTEKYGWHELENLVGFYKGRYAFKDHLFIDPMKVSIESALTDLLGGQAAAHSMLKRLDEQTPTAA